MSPHYTRLNRYTVLGLCAIVLWSTTIALGRRTAEALGPLTAGAATYLAGGVLLLFLDRLRKCPKHRTHLPPYRRLLTCGALFVMYSVGVYAALGLAVDRTQAIEVGLINYLWPTLTLLFSLVLLRHRAKFGFLPGTALALSGIFLVLMHGAGLSWGNIVSDVAKNNMIPFGLAFTAAVCWALYSNLTRRWAGPDTEKGTAPLFIPVTGVVMLVLRVFFQEQSVFSVRVGIELTVLAGATAFGYLFWETAMQRGDVVLVVAFSYFTPLLSTLISSMYLRVVPGKGTWIGCVLLVMGSFLSWRSIENEPAR